jgi:hypothetical protein
MNGGWWCIAPGISVSYERVDHVTSRGSSFLFRISGMIIRPYYTTLPISPTLTASFCALLHLSYDLYNVFKKLTTFPEFTDRQ